MYKIMLVALWMVIIGSYFQYSVATDDGNQLRGTSSLPALDSHTFQRTFLNQVTQQINLAIAKCIDSYLRDLQSNPAYSEYAQRIEETLRNSSSSIYDNKDGDNNKIVDEKIVFVKQLLDVRSKDEQTQDALYTLRNAKFLKKLLQRLAEQQAESERELHELKMYQLCQQFADEKNDTGHRTDNGSHSSHVQQPSVWAHIQLAPLAVDQLLRRDNLTRVQTPNPRPLFVSLLQFGATVYERIKLVGSEIIDNCLNTMRQLLIEVIEEKADNARHSESLNKLLHEVDAIMRMPDFAEKRARLYTYLQTEMSEDYEQFKFSSSSQQDLAELMLKMQLRGLDLFFNFLFSNFEFLEHLHAEWSALAESFADGGDGGHAVDAVEKDLHEVRQISTLYTDFKQHSDDPKKYEAYLTSTKNLYERTKSLPKSEGKIYEILYSAVQNVGAVTMNMIRSKCSQL